MYYIIIFVWQTSVQILKFFKTQRRNVLQWDNNKIYGEERIEEGIAKQIPDRSMICESFQPSITFFSVGRFLFEV